MHPRPIQEQPQRWLPSGATGQDRAQEGILDPQHPRAGGPGDGDTAPRRGGLAPDADPILGTGPAQAWPKPRKRQDTAQTTLRQEAAVEDKEPPGGDIIPSGGFPVGWRRRHGAAQSPSVASESADDAVPVIAPNVFCHCTKGASVT